MPFVAPLFAASAGRLALRLVTHFIPCALHLAEPVVIAPAGAFLATRHTLVAGREQLTRVLFPDVEGPLFLFGGEVVVFNQSIGRFIVDLWMFNFVGL